MVKHPSYKYVDMAMNGAQNRHIMTLDRIKGVTSKTDVYATYFRYDDAMAEHYRNKKTVAGFKGKVWADWLPIDIDDEDISNAQHSLKGLLMNLEDENIDLNTIKIFFSGSKGFHVMIPSVYFTKEPSEDMPKRFRRLALQLADTIKIDTAIYDKTRLFRLNNTINSKSGLHKIQISVSEANWLSVDEILALAKEPRQPIKTERQVSENFDLVERYHEPLKSISKNKETKSSGKLCMHKMMKGVPQGNRDNIGLRVATHLRQSGLNANMIWVALNEWNNANTPPLQPNELERIYEQAVNSNYEFGCHDPILKEFCNPDCLFYKKEWGRF